MKRKVAIAIAVVLIVVAGVAGFSVTRASAHNFDNYSLWSCAYAGRPDGSWNVDHSGPTRIWNGLVEYGCCIHDTDNGTQLGTRVKRDTNTGAIYRDDIYHIPPYPFSCY